MRLSRFGVVLIGGVVVLATLPHFLILDAPRGYSMIPTIAPYGEVMLCVPIRNISEIRRGDVVVAKSPVQFGQTVMKRVIAREGEIVTLREDERDFYQYLMRKSFSHPTSESVTPTTQEITPNPTQTPTHRTNQNTQYQIPQGHVWIEGDNKSASTDSRQYGALPVNLVTYKVLYRVWPYSRWGGLSCEIPNESGNLGMKEDEEDVDDEYENE
jgi:mitochondrial inner membrane protease subunit 1